LLLTEKNCRFQSESYTSTIFWRREYI